MELSETLKQTIREIPDFPKKGISFKDITPLLGHPELSAEITSALLQPFTQPRPGCIIGIESRGFLYGMLIADRLKIPFIPVRKQGKLPGDTISYGYQLEYGEAILEMHSDAITPGTSVLIHDDLLATGGTCEATAALVKQLGGTVLGFTFIVELEFLRGRERLAGITDQLHALVKY